MVEYTNPTPNTPRNRGDYDAPHMTPVTPAEDIRTIMINRVSWGAVAAGVSMALVLQLVFNLLGVGVGMIAMDYGADGASPDNMPLGALAWLGASGVVAALAGGYTAGRMAGETRESTAAWHGLISWAASVVIITGLIAAGASMLIGGTLNASGMTGPASMSNNYDAYGAVGGLGMTSVDEAGNMSVAVGPAGDRVVVDSATISRGALISAAALVLGALAAWFGGLMGVVQPTITTDRLRRRNLH